MLVNNNRNNILLTIVFYVVGDLLTCKQHKKKVSTSYIDMGQKQC